MYKQQPHLWTTAKCVRVLDAAAEAMALCQKNNQFKTLLTKKVQVKIHVYT